MRMAKRPWRRMTGELRRDAIRLASKGWSGPAIAAELKVGRESVRMVVRPMGGVFRPGDWVAPQGQLTMEDRAEIWIGLQAGESFPQIADRCGLHRGRVWREVSRNGGRESYRPVVAHKMACVRAGRPKETKLASNQRLREEVVRGLSKLWSPEQIAV